MADPLSAGSVSPWLTIIGLGEDGPDGLSPASHKALADAEVILGARRHLALLATPDAERIEWPVPFAEGISLLLSLRGRNVVVLASGDPFWFGAGSVIARHLDAGEWRALPGASVFALVAAELGWPLEKTCCRGLHAAPFDVLMRDLHQGARIIATLRDGAAVPALAAFLTAHGFGASALTVCEALGGPRARVTRHRADTRSMDTFTHPVTVAIEVAGTAVQHCASGQPDDAFDHDGQITKRPIRAITLSTLAPRPGEHLWDIGGGSGAISIEWLLCDRANTASVIERDTARAARIAKNAARFGVSHLDVRQAAAPDLPDDLPQPDAIFIGGGLSDTLIDHLRSRAAGARLVTNAVTLESETLIATWQKRIGGTLMRVEISEPHGVGRLHAWRAAYPVTQWSVVL